MKVFRHINGNLYTIEQVGRGRTITPPYNYRKFYGYPYKTNKDAPVIGPLEDKNDLSEFKIEFEE